MLFVPAIVHIFSISDPKENVCTIALITIHYLYSITSHMELQHNITIINHWPHV